jgi:hypothetical protein
MMLMVVAVVVVMIMMMFMFMIVIVIMTIIITSLLSRKTGVFFFLARGILLEYQGTDFGKGTGIGETVLWV